MLYMVIFIPFENYMRNFYPFIHFFKRKDREKIQVYNIAPYILIIYISECPKGLNCN